MGITEPLVGWLEVKVSQSAYLLKNGKPAGHRSPSQPQKDAGNYEKAHPLVHGMRVSIENAANTTRTGMAEGGKVWKSKMAHDYGYIRGTKGKDKDHIDVYLGPDPHGDHPVHVIDQNHANGDFDEHKAMVGFPNATHAVIAYHQNFEPGWDRFRGVTSMPMDQFKQWAYAGNERGKQKPAAEYAAFTGAGNAKPTTDEHQPVRVEAGPGAAQGDRDGAARGNAATGADGLHPVDGRGKQAVGSGERDQLAGGGRVRHPGRHAQEFNPIAQGANRYPGAADQSQRVAAILAAGRAGVNVNGPQEATAGTGWPLQPGSGGGTQDLERGPLSAMSAPPALPMPVGNGLGVGRLPALLRPPVQERKAGGSVDGEWRPHGNVWSKGGVAGMPNLKLDGPSFKKGGSVPDEEEDPKVAKAADKAAKAAQKVQDAQALKTLTESPGQTMQRAHPMEISTRVPTHGDSTEDPIKSLLTVGLDTMKGKPSAFEKNVGIVRSYPNYKDDGKAKTTDEHAEAFINHVKDNLLYLHDKMREQHPEASDRAMQWYEGANKIANEMANRYGLQPHQGAGMIAALSPQTDWDINLSRAERIAKALHDHQGHAWTPEMEKTSADVFGKEQYADQLNAIRGKTLGQVGSDPVLQAMWIRTHDQAHNDRGYDAYAPEGNKVSRAQTNGKDAITTWGDLPSMAKAIRIYTSPDLNTVSANMGGNHKVRNFYNNILDPNNPNGHVTIDTHAVAGGLMRPLGSKAEEVSHNFGGGNTGGVYTQDPAMTGQMGTYGLYADAYRRAAAERGIQPRQMQSITWEAARNLFTKKKQADIDTANAIWDNYRHGNLSPARARDQILAAAGGIKAPSWSGSGAGSLADEGASDAPVVPQIRVPGRGASPALSGPGSIATGTTALARRGRQSKGSLATGAEPQGLSDGGSVSGSQGQLEASDREDRKHSRFASNPLKGLPTSVDIPGHGKVQVGPLQHVREAAAAYMQRAGLPYKPPTDFVDVDKARAARVAQAYDAMKHEPGHPAVKAAYDQMIKEVNGQYQAALNAGLKVDFIHPDMEDPYAASPRLATEDVRHNNHMWVYPTSSGFGSTDNDVSNNPLLAPTEHKISGQPAVANDLFRVVHDYFGHMKEGVGFRANGEENAWRQHSAMFSPLARRAMTSETRGQNSWVNYGPHGDTNRTASSANTHFADQKSGLLPSWVHTEGSGQDDDDERKGYACGGSIPMPSDLRWRQVLAQGGIVKGGRLYLEDGGSDAPGGDGTGGGSGSDAGGTGAAGTGSGSGTAPAGGATGTDPGVGDPGAMGVAQGDIGTSQPAAPAQGGQPNFFGLTLPAPIATLATQVANMAAHGLGFPSLGVGLANAATNHSASQASSATLGTIGMMAAGPIGGVVGSVVGNMVGNMPGVPSASVPTDPTGATAGMTSSISDAALSGMTPTQMAAYQAATRLDPMGTRRLLQSSPSGGSAAVYGQAPGNWGTGLQNGWGMATGGAVPHAQIRLLAGPLSRGTGRMNG